MHGHLACNLVSVTWCAALRSLSSSSSAPRCAAFVHSAQWRVSCKACASLTVFCAAALQEKITKNVEREILNHYSLIHVRIHCLCRLPALQSLGVMRSMSKAAALK
jgi:hypothetical protein